MSDEAKRKAVTCPACRGGEAYRNDDSFEKCETCEGGGMLLADDLLEDWKKVIRVYKQIRQTHDLTLGFLRGVTGIKVSVLSDIERGSRLLTNSEWDSIRESMPDLPHNWLDMKDYKSLPFSVVEKGDVGVIAGVPDAPQNTNDANRFYLWQGVIQRIYQIRRRKGLSTREISERTGIEIDHLMDMIDLGRFCPTDEEWELLRSVIPDLPFDWMGFVPEAERLNRVMESLVTANIEWSIKCGRGYPVVDIQVGGFSIHMADLDDLTVTAEKLAAALTEGYDRVMRWRKAEEYFPAPNKPEVGRDGKK